jgi:hypothetical protein
MVMSSNWLEWPVYTLNCQGPWTAQLFVITYMLLPITQSMSTLEVVVGSTHNKAIKVRVTYYGQPNYSSQLSVHNGRLWMKKINHVPIHLNQNWALISNNLSTEHIMFCKMPPCTRASTKRNFQTESRARGPTIWVCLLHHYTRQWQGRVLDARPWALPLVHTNREGGSDR